MALVKQDDAPEVWVLRDECLGFACFAPGVYRKDGEPACTCRETEPLHCCTTAAFHGCPLPGAREYDKKTFLWRRRHGWKVTQSARLQ
jgi:hypothetical protein